MWIDHVLNPKTITSIYPAQAPSLGHVHLHELAILCGGDLQCRLRFDLPDLPLHAPAKWVQQYNTVQLTLSFIQVTIDHCAIPSGNGIGELRIRYEEDRFHVEFHTPAQGSVFRAAATWAHVDQIAGYLNQPD
ncbi:MAG: hypothetical protein EOO60_12650 [Hymenobacter sp.]|nr:MAG: hypothetical protein EOO60_12650 [Hymenobacter sp.]